MTLRQLETLYAIMRAGSITAAARNLHVTQPAVSAVLKHTEQQLKMKLFERIGGRLQSPADALALIPDLEGDFWGVHSGSRTGQGQGVGRTRKPAIVPSPP